MKKFLSVILSFAMVFALSVQAFALDVVPATNPSVSSNIEIPVLNSEGELSDAEKIAFVNENGARGIFIEGWATYALVRSSSTSESCDLIINWSGEMASGFRCKKVTIKSTSLLFPKTYDTSGNGTTYTTKNFVASILATVTFGTYTIPTDVEKATVSISSGQIYILSNASWAAAAKSSYTTDIE